MFSKKKKKLSYTLIKYQFSSLAQIFFQNEVIFSLQVFAGAKPLLDKTLGILVEGLIDTFLSLFHENKTKDLRSLDANGFCQLMLEVKYGVQHSLL